jgi:hypothetical protein
MLEDLGTNLFVLYIALAANFLTPLLPINVSPMFKDSMGLRHLIAFIGLVFLTVVSDAEFDSVESIGLVLLGCAAIYFWFMLASKMTANWWILLVILVAALYLMNIYKIYTKRPTAETKKYLQIGEYVAMGASALVTIFGFLIYVGERKIKYRGKFDFATLILGTPMAKGTPSKSAYWDSLKAAFLVAPGSASAFASRVQSGGFVSDDSIAPVSSFDFVAAT